MKPTSQTPELAAARAMEFVADGQVLGLGSGRAASAFIRALGERVRGGLHVRGVPTSEASAALATECGIPLASFDEIEAIDVTFDGADEVALPSLDIVKGLGGAMLRERVVAAAARQWVILVGADKLSAGIGSRGVLPVEVAPFAAAFCRRRLEALGLPSEFRQGQRGRFVTDNGNLVLDLRIGPLDDPAGLDRAIRAIPGVLETGLFLGMTPTLIVQDGETVSVRRPGS